MEKEDIIGLTQQLYGSYFLQNLVKEYQLNGIDSDEDEDSDDLVGLFNERSHIGVSDMSVLINHLAELRKMDKKVFSGEVKDYGNGIPKTWDDENF